MKGMNTITQLQKLLECKVGDPRKKEEEGGEHTPGVPAMKMVNFTNDGMMGKPSQWSGARSPNEMAWR